MDLTNLITHIDTNCTGVQQVIDASGTNRDTVDTSAILYTLLSGTFNNRLYPLTLPKEKEVFPAAVYALQSSKLLSVDSVDVFQRDVFILYFQTETTTTGTGGFSTLVGLRETVRDIITGYGTSSNAIEIEITDESLDYVDDVDRYQCAMQIHVTYVIGTTQAAPVVFVLEESSIASPSELDNCIAQEKDTTVSLIIVCDESDIEVTRSCLQTQLLGYQLTSDYDAMELIAESRIDAIGGLVIWQQQYATSIQIRET